MKIKLLILLLFCWFGSFAQSVPNTTTFRLTQVVFAVYGDSASGRNLADAFTNSDSLKFDPAYGYKTMNPKTMLGFRNYGACTRPSPINSTDFYTVVNGVTVTSVNYCSLASNPCGTCSFLTFQAIGASLWYNGTGADCTLAPDGYYAIWNGSWWIGYHIVSGVLNLCPQ